MCSGCKDPWGPIHKDFIRGGVPVDDFEKEVNYSPKKKKKGCKRSKNGLPCEFNVPVVKYQWYSAVTDRWRVTKEMTCSRCGKRDWASYLVTWSKTKV